MLRIITCNDDFTDRLTNVPGLIRRHRPLAILVQEAKNTDLHKATRRLGYGVRQQLRSDARAGSAVLWSLRHARAVGTAVDDPTRLGHGLLAIAYPRGRKMLTRYMAWQDVEIGRPGSRRYVRLASYHRPPPRYRDLWRESDARLAEWAAASLIPVILGTDANTPEFRALAKRLGFRAARGVGIDCVMIRGRVRFTGGPARALARRTSDHTPVMVKVRVRRSRKVTA